VAKEVDFLKTLTVFDEQDGVKRVEGRFEKLQKYLEKAPSHVIHFAGHGTHKVGEGNVSSSAIALSDGDMNSTTLEGILGYIHVNRPFFFLNACEVGQSGSFAGFVDGFAPAVLDAGASGYIGALWSIGDRGAEEFAESFYKTMSTELEKNGSVSMAELMRKTKAEYAKNGDPTFLAYIFYGDPNLTLVSGQ
jgi:CHAT domain-containing protein